MYATPDMIKEKSDVLQGTLQIEYEYLTFCQVTLYKRRQTDTYYPTSRWCYYIFFLYIWLFQKVILLYKNLTMCSISYISCIDQLFVKLLPVSLSSNELLPSSDEVFSSSDSSERNKCTCLFLLYIYRKHYMK
jgi:hypothetical protein